MHAHLHTQFLVEDQKVEDYWYLLLQKFLHNGIPQKQIFLGSLLACDRLVLDPRLSLVLRWYRMGHRSHCGHQQALGSAAAYNSSSWTYAIKLNCFEIVPLLKVLKVILREFCKSSKLLGQPYDLSSLASLSFVNWGHLNSCSMYIMLMSHCVQLTHITQY